MCGLVGFLNASGAPLNSNHLQALTECGTLQHHRGPDQQQVAILENFGVAFQRLSIVDLSGGSQPFTSEDGRYILTMVGEVYNHKELRAQLASRHTFRSSSDIEVALHLYEEHGTAAFEKLRGMYAGCIFDKLEQKLILLRDRLGIKPMYWGKTEDSSLVFATELKALWAWPGLRFSFDWERAFHHTLLTEECALRASEPTSFFSGLNPLSPGHYLTVDCKRRESPREYRYWNLFDCTTKQCDKSSGEVVRHYLEILTDSVQEMIPHEVSWGIFLSGGLDSSAVAALAHTADRSGITFTVRSPGTDATGDYKYARLIAEKLGLNWCELKLPDDEGTVTCEEWIQLLWTTENPTTNVEQLFKRRLYQYAKSLYPGTKVMLSGQGSDEFNGGYGQMLLSNAQERTWRGLNTSLEKLRCTKAYSTNVWSEKLGIRNLDCRQKEQTSETENQSAWDYYLRCKLRDLHDYNLWHEDRIAAGSSVENRVPFLDHRLVEYSYQIANSEHTSLLFDKVVLRQGLAVLIPPEVAKRSKKPFYDPARPQSTYNWARTLLGGESEYNVIEVAYSMNENAKKWIEKNRLVDALNARAKVVHPSIYPVALRFLNMVLLESLARDAAQNFVRPGRKTAPHPGLTFAQAKSSGSLAAQRIEI